METPASSFPTSQFSLPEQFVKYVADASNTNDNSNSSCAFNRTELEKNPKALTQLICYLCHENTGKIQPQTQLLLEWAEELHKKKAIPLHHFLKIVCWFPDWIANNQAAFAHDLNQLLAQTSLSEKSLQRVQKIAKIIQKNVFSIEQHLPTSIITSYQEALPNILLFAESEEYRENGWQAKEWDSFSSETIQVAFHFCKTGELVLSFSTDDENALLLSNVLLLAEKFAMENLQKKCHVTFFSSMSYLQPLFTNARETDVAWWTLLLSTQFHSIVLPSSDQETPLSLFGPSASPATTAEYLVNFCLSVHHSNQHSRTMLQILCTFFMNFLENSYREKKLELPDMLRAFLCVPFWIEKRKNQFTKTINTYTENITLRLKTSCNNNNNDVDETVERELTSIADVIRLNFFALRKYLPDVPFASCEDKTYSAPPLLLLAESKWLRLHPSSIGKIWLQPISENKTKGYIAKRDAQETVDLLVRLFTTYRELLPSLYYRTLLLSFATIVAIYKIANDYQMERIKEFCRKKISSSTDFCKKLLADSTGVTDPSIQDLYDLCMQRIQSNSPLYFHLFDDHFWYINLSDWKNDFAFASSSNIGAWVTTVSITENFFNDLGKRNSFATPSSPFGKYFAIAIDRHVFENMHLLKKTFPNLRVYIRNSSFSRYQDECSLLIENFPKLESVYIQGDHVGENIFRFLQENEHSELLKKIPKRLSQYDVILFNNENTAINLAEYPAAAKDAIRLLLYNSSPFRPTTLDLANCSHISIELICSLFEKYRFTEISLARCTQITDTVLQQMEKQAQYLKKLDLSSTGAAYSEKALYQLVENCTQLEELCLHDCPTITETFDLCTKEIRRTKKLVITREKSFRSPLYNEGNANDCEAETIHENVKRQIDKDGCVHYVIQDPTMEILIETRNALDKYRDWGRLESLEITDSPERWAAIHENDKKTLDNDRKFLLHFLKKCRTLKTITIHSALFDNTILSILPEACPQIRDFSLDIAICPKIPPRMGNFIGEFLHLTACSFTGKPKQYSPIGDKTVEQILRRNSRIRSLNFSYSNITEHGMEIIARTCSDLEELHIENCCYIGDKGLEKVVQQCTSLKVLNIRSCSSISHAAILRILLDETKSFSQDNLFWDFGKWTEKGYVFPSLDNLPESIIMRELERIPCLERLSVQGCQEVSDSFLDFLSVRYPKIRGIDLRGCRQMTSDGILRFVEKCGSIDSLRLASNLTTEEAILAILEQCPMLKCLALENCSGVTDQVLKKLQHLRLPLEHLSLARCTNFSSKRLLALAKTYKKCRKIDLHGCSQLAGRAIVTLAQSSKNHIVTLNLLGCTQLRDRDIAAILASCKQLRSLYIDNHDSYSDGPVVAKKQKEPSPLNTGIPSNLPDNLSDRNLAHCSIV